ncbi:MAG: hypothetical protein U0638_12555 [Phycisphaerales bacterium]
MNRKKPGNRNESTRIAGLRLLRQRLDELLPKGHSQVSGRPLVRGSQFSFDETGCVANPRQVFQAIMEGTIKSKEVEMVLLHKLHCWKCNQTFAALRSEFEDNLRKRYADALKGRSSDGLGDSQDQEYRESPQSRRRAARGGK